jgi:hypothetical protein
MQPVAVGEDGKVRGGRSGDRYFSLIFHGCVCRWCKVGVIVFMNCVQNQKSCTPPQKIRTRILVATNISYCTFAPRCTADPSY